MKDIHRKCLFDKETTDLIKGILLIIMFVLHLFCFPSWYVNGIEYPNLFWLEKYQGHLQICITGFTFLTGYLYYFSSKKNFKYVVKKWIDILIPYWLVYFIFFSIAIVTNTYIFHIQSFILQIFALEYSIMFFCWYVSYYLLMIVALWWIIKYVRNDIIKWFISLVGSFALYWLSIKVIRFDFLINVFEKFSVYFPMVITGFICAKRSWFERIYKIVGNKKTICAFFLLIIVFMEPSWLYSIEINNYIFEFVRKCIRIMSIPLFVWSLITIVTYIKNKITRVLLKMIGKYSMIMWFVHSIFFNCSKEYFQSILYMPKYPILVLLWGLILCWFIAVPLELIISNVKKKIPY